MAARTHPRPISTDLTAPAPGLTAGLSGLKLALPKGRLLGPLAKRLAPAGLDLAPVLADSRQLRFTLAGGVTALLVKPTDVVTYVARGACELGVVGYDKLLEDPQAVYELHDLGIGVCRLVVAGPPAAAELYARRAPMRVGTIFPHAASNHFAQRGQPADVVALNGSVELAPLSDLADCIVDLVETGETLRQNNLVIIDTLATVSARLIANRAALKLSRARIMPFVEALQRAAPATGPYPAAKPPS